MISLEQAITELNTGIIEFEHSKEVGCLTEGEVVILLKRLKEFEEIGLEPDDIKYFFTTKSNSFLSECNFDYLSQFITITDEIKRCIYFHCNKYKLSKINICAWYKDMNDFYTDWRLIGYNIFESNNLFTMHPEEFLILPHKQGIIRIC